VRIKGLGCDKYQDGFDVNDDTIKSKIVSIIACGDTQLALNLTLLDAQIKFTPEDLVSYFVATKNIAKEGKRVKELYNGMDATHSVALKAKVVQDLQ
jgi:hypothetical protein